MLAPRRLLLVVLLMTATFASALISPIRAQPPRTTDDRLQLELIAEHPQLVTPVGLAIAPDGQAYVVESHTHFPPEDYAGPAHDRILRFDTRQGSDAEHSGEVFFEGTTHTMQLLIDAADPAMTDGAPGAIALLVATRSELFRLYDDDRDGRADRRVDLLRLETTGDYPHNGLSGIAQDANGDLWVGMGENLGEPYQLIAADGTEVAGGGEGGNIFRCDRDGGSLRRWSTGFWNAFALAFDPAGRLFMVDNDPDARPPCRLLHVVRQGDYGYRFRYGRSGKHPFVAWDGELPHTLPQVAGTGEAPSGLIYYDGPMLPHDAPGVLLGTSWGSHRIEQFTLQSAGASWRAERTTLVQGDNRFRPVGIAAAPDGSVWFTDWVDKSYNVHRQGRLWRLSSTDNAGASSADTPSAGTTNAAADDTDSSDVPDAAERRDTLQRLVDALQSGDTATADAMIRTSNDIDHWHRYLTLREDVELPDLTREMPESPELQATLLRRHAAALPATTIAESLGDADPFLRQAARLAVVGQIEASHLDFSDVDLRAYPLEALLIRQQLGTEPSLTQFQRWLQHEDRAVRQMALIWIGESSRTDARALVERSLVDWCDTAATFTTALATLDRLDHPDRSYRDEWQIQDYAATVLDQPDVAVPVLQTVIRMLDPDHSAWTAERIGQLLQHPELSVRTELVRTLRLGNLPGRAEHLRAIADDSSLPASLRSEAILGLPTQDRADQRRLAFLASGQQEEVAHAALRRLRGVSSDEAGELFDVVAKQSGIRWRELFDRAKLAKPADRTELVDPDMLGKGNRQLGERLFFSAQLAGCYRCHEVNGRGTSVGPNLTGIGRTSSRERLLDSILRPSREIAPQFVTWTLEIDDGRVWQGQLLGEDDQNVRTYVDSNGQQFHVPSDTIQRAVPQMISVMPTHLVDQLTDHELASLLDFLAE